MRLGAFFFRGELVTITTTIGKHHGSDTASSRAQAPHYSLALLWNVKTHAVLPYYGATYVRMCVRKFVWCSRLEASLLRSWPVAPSRAPPESNPGSDLPWLEASPIQTFVLRRQPWSHGKPHRSSPLYHDNFAFFAAAPEEASRRRSVLCGGPGRPTTTMLTKPIRRGRITMLLTKGPPYREHGWPRPRGIGLVSMVVVGRVLTIGTACREQPPLPAHDWHLLP